jgi:hypothetical protein
MAASLAGCKCEGGKIIQAAQDFMDFSEGKDKVVDPYKPKARQEFVIRRWQEEYVGQRHRAIVDVEVSPRIGRKKLEKLLRDAVHDPALQRSTSALMVRAWPGKLQRLSAPLGIATFARDGHGWDGKGVGFEQIQVLLPDPEERRARKLDPLSEQEYLMVLGVENMVQRGDEMLPAQEATADRHGVNLATVQAACLRSAKLAQWYKARAEALSNPAPAE